MVVHRLVLFCAISYLIGGFYFEYLFSQSLQDVNRNDIDGASGRLLFVNSKGSSAEANKRSDGGTRLKGTTGWHQEDRNRTKQRQQQQQHYDDTNHQYSDDSSYSFEEVWPMLQSNLCPKPLTPNTQLASLVLFPLAAQQLNMTINPSNGVFGSWKMSKRFYSGSFAKMVEVYNPATNGTITYLPIWKCANDQIRSYLQSTYLPLNNKKDTTNANPLSTMDNPNRRQQKKNSCIVTVIRDPISHFLSGYNEIEYRMMIGDKGARKVGQPTTHRSLKLGSPERFEEFVKEGILGKRSSRNEHWYMDHVFSMSRILAYYGQVVLGRRRSGPSITESLTAYLPTLTNLTYSFPAFLDTHCGGGDGGDDGGEPSISSSGAPPAPTNTMPLTGQHSSSIDKLGTYQAAKETWYSKGPTARALCILHVMDYACWTDLKIPKFCQEVYAEPHFVHTVTDSNYYYHQQLLQARTRK